MAWLYRVWLGLAIAVGLSTTAAVAQGGPNDPDPYLIAASMGAPPGYDPFRAPVPDRVPDDYINFRPVWYPTRPQFRTSSGYVVQSAWEAEFGGRYFGSTGTKQFDLFGFPPGLGGNLLVSRLTYRDLTAHAGEAFGRVEHGTGLFVKGYVGGGVIPGGTLQDEDFPPVIDPYSSTDSQLRNGTLGYGAIDFGWAWRSRTFKVGFFAGYFHYSERLDAFGCVQTAGNPFICVPPLLPSDFVIRQDIHWDAARLGINGEWKITEGLRLSAEVAWLPLVWLNGTDTHFFTFGTTGHGGADAFSSVQLEAVLKYYFPNGFSVGVGGRYWNLRTAGGNTVVDFVPVGGGPQAAAINMERWGAFVQTSYQFGHLPPSGGGS